jgi:hypothetical protein
MGILDVRKNRGSLSPCPLIVARKPNSYGRKNSGTGPRMMEEAEEDDILSVHEAKKFYKSLKKD